MRLRHKNWMYGLLAAGFALSLTAAGCGDDDSADTAGTGGTGAGTKAGGSGGTGGAKPAGSGGTGGAKPAGSGGTGGTGGPVTAAACKTETMAAVMGGLSMDCVNCVCDANAMAILACTRSSSKKCWPLISCIGAMCAGLSGADQTSCAVSKCSGDMMLNGGTDAMMAGPVITGAMCSSKCVSGGGGDAGVKDAGF